MKGNACDDSLCGGNGNDALNALERFTEQNTLVTITPMSTTMVVEEATPTQLRLAKLPRQRPSLTRRRPAFWPKNSGSALETYYRCRSWPGTPQTR